MNRRKQSLTRAEIIRQRRLAQLNQTSTHQNRARLMQTTTRVYQPETVYLPASQRYARKRRSSHKQRYGINFTVGTANVRAPALSIPYLGSRLISGLLLALSVYILYTFWTSSSFTVTGSEISGNQRLLSSEIETTIHMLGQPIFRAVPKQIEIALRANYLDLANAKVHISFPNRIIVDVTERSPVLVWYQNGALAWIDKEGVAFPPRGDASGLISIMANGAPPPIQIDAQMPAYEQPYVSSDIVQAMTTLILYAPADTPLIYDPQYGMGWQDVSGWFVYFGQDAQEIPLKLQVYQAIIENLTNQSIQPTLISIEYLEAPFYK